MKLKQLMVGPLQVNCYLLACPETEQAWAIDPGDEGERILATLAETGWQLQAVVNTHGHFDHVGGNRALVEATGAELLIHALDAPLLERVEQHAAAFGLPAIPSPPPSRLLQDGDRLSCGSLEFEVLHIPGHSPGGICLHHPGHLFVGDVLFAGSIGRTDLPGGSTEALIGGIRQRLWALPDATRVYPGHGPATSIGQEKLTNPFVGG